MFHAEGRVRFCENVVFYFCIKKIPPKKKEGRTKWPGKYEKEKVKS